MARVLFPEFGHCLNSDSAKLRVGFLGVGSIARYHAEVLQAMGHLVCVACGTSAESPRWRDFKAVATQARFESDIDAVLEDPNIDAVVACLPWHVTESWLPNLLATPKPVLLEKPIALSSKALSSALALPGSRPDNKFVGFNRRYYQTVQKLKERVSQGGAKSAEITISETVAGLAATYGPEIIEHIFVYSSCHPLDTAIYILGTLRLVEMYGFRDSEYARPFSSISGLLETNEGIPVFLSVMADNPSPMGIRIYFDDQTTWHLSPLERLVAYSGYDVIEPTADVNIRRYVPKPFLEINEDATFKPGFLGQMEAFTGGPGRQIAATLEQSLGLLQFTESIQQLADANIQKRLPEDAAAVPMPTVGKS